MQNEFTKWENALIMRHGKEVYEKLRSATVAVCGLGGLGTNIAVPLTRAGVGKLILIDFDKVDITNLHRQQYKFSQVGKFKTDALKENLLEINPYIDVETYTVRLTQKNIPHLIENASVVCEAFDDAEEKAMLVNFVLEKMPEKYIVSGSGMAGFDSGNTIKTKKITDRFYVCGDEVNEVGRGKELVSSRVMLCAAHQAHTVLGILTNKIE